MCVAIKDYMYSLFLGKKRKSMWSGPKKKQQKKRLPRGKITE